MSNVDVFIPPKLIPVFTGEADVRGSYGGRGSAKTRTFAIMACVWGMRWAEAGHHGIILCGRQYMNSLDDSSLEEIKGAIRLYPFLQDYYDVGEKYVRTKNGRIEFKFTGLDRNIDSVKSKSKILLCWVDEAETVQETAWVKLIPTIREEGSELWVTWNPERKGSATDKRFRQTKDPRFKVIELNWRDNPKFPEKLNRERERDKENNPDQYDHIWEGDYKNAIEGAYFAKHILKAKEQNRICKLDRDPLFVNRVFVDIGGTGAKADAFVMWVCQFISKEIRVFNYYEAVGQPAEAHFNWLRENDYTPSNTQVWLPHDGRTKDKVNNVSYESAFQQVGYKVTVIPNQGAGAAKQRIEAVRRLFPIIYIDSVKCSAGIDALSWYHEKRDETRDIGLGPNHDWASHGADAFGYMAISHKEEKPRKQLKPPKTMIA